MLTWLHGQGFPKNKDTQLKPAVEPCVLAKKPGRVGKLNIDSCRVGDGFDRTAGGPSGKRKNPDQQYSGGWSHEIAENGKERPSGGRWPANLILDEESAAMLDEQSGNRPNGYRKNPSKTSEKSRTTYGYFTEGHEHGERGYKDSGGASRFFYCTKVSTRERNFGGIDCRHPTLKPIALTTYLSRLLLPPPSSTPRRILIPFSGAGSEMIGALLAGWDGVVGVEMDAECVSWSRARIKAVRSIGESKL